MEIIRPFNLGGVRGGQCLNGLRLAPPCRRRHWSEVDVRRRSAARSVRYSTRRTTVPTSNRVCPSSRQVDVSARPVLVKTCDRWRYRLLFRTRKTAAAPRWSRYSPRYTTCSPCCSAGCKPGSSSSSSKMRRPRREVSRRGRRTCCFPRPSVGFTVVRSPPPTLPANRS